MHHPEASAAVQDQVSGYMLICNNSIHSNRQTCLAGKIYRANAKIHNYEEAVHAGLWQRNTDESWYLLNNAQKTRVLYKG